MISGKNIVVTGASSGIGKSIMEELLAQDEGCRILAACRRAEMIADYGDRVIPFSCDLSTKEGVAALFEKASRIVPHDVDPKYGRLMLLGNIATLYYFLDEKDKALEMLKEHNEAGVFDSRIVSIMALKGDMSEEFRRRIINSFWDTINNIINTTYALLLFYKNRGDLTHLKILARWGVDYLCSIRKNDDPCFLDKQIAAFTAAESYAYLKSGDPDKAMDLLKEAKEVADRYDQAPNYSVDIIKLFDNDRDGNLVDILGKTAAESMEKLISIIGDRKFTSMWRKLNK